MHHFSIGAHTLTYHYSHCRKPFVNFFMTSISNITGEAALVRKMEIMLTSHMLSRDAIPGHLRTGQEKFSHLRPLGCCAIHNRRSEEVYVVSMCDGYEKEVLPASCRSQKKHRLHELAEPCIIFKKIFLCDKLKSRYSEIFQCTINLCPSVESNNQV